MIRSLRCGALLIALVLVIARGAAPALAEEADHEGASPAAAGAPVAAARAASAAHDPRPPNIIIILADDLGYGDLSCYGSDTIETPHIDRLAARGVRFTDFHSSAPVCSPTRAGLLTGRYQQRAGIPGVIYANPKRNRHHGLQPKQEVTFAELLTKAGYATAIFGKWHLGYLKKYNPLHHGFDRFVGYVSGNVDYISHVDGTGVFDWWHGLQKVHENGYTTHLITKHAVKFIENHRDQPFCLYVAHQAPHFPYQTPQSEPIREVGENKPRTIPENVHEIYEVMVEEMDQSVGRIVQTLDRLGLTRNTFIFFLSDNGAVRYGSNGPLRGHKGQLWEGGHRVPAIACWPGHIRPGRVTDQTAISIDLFPTILALAGVEAPEGLEIDGVNLLPLLLEGEPLPSRTLFWAYREQRAVRHGPWKLLLNAPGLRPGEPALFNLEKDLDETHNVASEHPRRVQRMLRKLEAWEKEVHQGATEQPEKRPRKSSQRM